MSRVLSVLFWLLAAPTGLLAAVVVLMALSGRPLSAATPAWLSLLAALGVLALLVWARRFAGARPGLAILITAGSWLLFATVMIANGLLHQSTWQ